MISQKELKHLRETFQPGTLVKLIKMDDPYSKLKPGDIGKVVSVDDIGTIHVSWASGSSLGIVYGEDQCEIVK